MTVISNQIDDILESLKKADEIMAPDVFFIDYIDQIKLDKDMADFVLILEEDNVAYSANTDTNKFVISSLDSNEQFTIDLHDTKKIFEYTVPKHHKQIEKLLFEAM